MESFEELLEVAKRRSIGFFICVIGLAYLMSLTSNSMWINVPVAILMISLLRFLSFELEVRRRIRTPQVPTHLQHLHKRHISTNDPLLYSSGVPLRWKKKIDAPAVEAAVDEFTRRLVHELIVDLWYSSITSDQEAPNELIVIVNELLGEVSQRAKRVNLISLLTRDVVDLVRSHLELYRKVQAQIGVNVLDTCSFEERDEKLKKVLASSRELHPAVVSPEAETQVLQRLMGGLLVVVLRPQDAQCKLLRCFARELLACAVLRPIMSFASPGFINELIEQSALKSKESAKKKKRQRSSDFSSLQGPPDRHISSKDETLSGLEMTEVAALESTLSSDGLESMEAVHGMKSKAYSGYSQAIKTMTGADSLTRVEPREKAPGDSNLAKAKVGTIGGHEIVAVHSNECFVEGAIGLRKQLSDDYANIAQGVFEGDWAHVLEVVSQRKTQALAPEHLDNLWAKGRNYKKREIMKSLAKPAEVENLLIARGKGSLLKPLPPKHTYNERAKQGVLKESNIGASLIDGRARPTGLEHLSSSERPDKLETDSTKSKMLRVLNESSVKLQEEPRKGNAAENSQLSDSHGMGTLKTQVSDSNSTVGPYTIWHPLESYEAPQSCDTSGRELRTSMQLRRTKSIDSGLDGWHEQVQKPASIPSQGQVIGAANKGVMSGTSMEFNDLDASSVIGLASTWKLQCRVLGAHFEKSSSKSFVVYSISVTNSDGKSWIVQRRYRNFEQLHRRLKDMPNYSLTLPPKRFLSSNLDNAFVRERCILLHKYLKDLLAVPSIAELHEVWDFLSSSSQNYAFGHSTSIIKTLAVNVDDAVEDMFRQIKGVSEDLQGAIKTATTGIKKRVRGTKNLESAVPVVREALVRPQVVSSILVSNDNNVGYKEYVNHESDEEEDKFMGRPPESSFLQVVPSSGWHSDGDIQGERLESSTTRSTNFEALDLYKSCCHLERTMDASIAEDYSPVDSIAGSDMIEDDLAIPHEWNPPKLSVPLMNLVDTIFQLEGRGWIRRQVFWIAKQILQLGMGDAIDDWILAKIQWLRREDVVVSGVKLVQEALWPDGIFIIKHPKYQILSSSSGDKGGIKTSSFEQQLEAARRAMVAREIILEHAPAPLVSLIGRKQYHRCAKDIYFFLQSAVCVKQLAYSLLEMLLIASFPELHELIIDIRSS